VDYVGPFRLLHLVFFSCFSVSFHLILFHFDDRQLCALSEGFSHTATTRRGDITLHIHGLAQTFVKFQTFMTRIFEENNQNGLKCWNSNQRVEEEGSKLNIVDCD
jgi:hypothetical protein